MGGTIPDKRVLPVHPVVFAAFPLLALFAGNIGKFPIEQVLRPLAFSVLGSTVLWALFTAVTRNARKAALATSVVVVGFFSYGHLYKLSPVQLQGVLAPLSIAAVAILGYRILRSGRSFVDATRVFNLASIVLIAPSAWTIGASFWTPTSTDGHGIENGELSLDVRRFLAPEPPTAKPSPPLSASELPDVYYIVLDAYGREDRLKTFYGFDNAPFIDALRKRGFFVAQKSGANYDQTTLCLASALNMNYLDTPKEIEEAAKEWKAPIPLRRMIDENRVAAHLRKFGYQYVSIWAGLEETRVKTADLLLNGEKKQSSFEDETLGLTAIESTPQAQRQRYDEHRERVMGGFHSLERVPTERSPKFVFAHILAPHPPFVFGAGGESVYPRGPMGLADASWLLREITPEEYRKGYTDQLRYVNRRVLAAVDTILRRSRKRPVIILQGDHGSRMNLDWESQERTDLREPFSILNAYHVPPRVREKLYDTMSPVNSFRILLRELFGASYRTLADRSFYSTASRPTEFSEVTDLLSRMK
jgi:hypothetical protein